MYSRLVYSMMTARAYLKFFFLLLNSGKGIMPMYVVALHGTKLGTEIKHNNFFYH